MSLLVRDGTRCIYCLSDSTSSERKAHVYPQCILKNEITLPLGVECDSCNHFHGKVEQELLNHNRIGAPALFNGVPGKRGRARRGHGNIERDVAGNISLRGVAKLVSAGADELAFEYTEIAPLDDARFRRALCHIAFNYTAFIEGADVARESRFDEIRNFVRRGTGAKWPYAQFMHPDKPLRTELGFRILRGDFRNIVQIRTYVDDFYVDPESRDDYIFTWANRTLPRGWHQG